MLFKKSIFTFVYLNIFLFAKLSPAQDNSFMAVSVAAFDVIQQHEPAIEGRLEYRLNKTDWKFDPFLGIMANSDQAKHFYFGAFMEFEFWRNFIFSPSFAPGLYFKGNSKDLSFVLEFRSQIEVSYRFKNDVRIGVSLDHISNASIKPPNIGVESLALTAIFPIN